eukprot:6014480-Amphidinium_carterae.2
MISTVPQTKQCTYIRSTSVPSLSGGSVLDDGALQLLPACNIVACQYHLFFIPSFTGGDLACIHCRATDLDDLSIELLCVACSPDLGYYGGVLRLSHTPSLESGRRTHDADTSCGLTAHEWLASLGWKDIQLL